MTNADVARILHETADLMDIRGDDSFRINAYRRAGRAIDDLAGDVADLAARGQLASITGIGKGTAAKIVEILSTGRLTAREEIAAQVPPTLLELLRIPSLGPKKAALLWRERGVTSLADLKAAIESGALQGVKGLGPRSIEQLREGIDFLSRTAGRTRLGQAWAVAESLRAALLTFEGVQRVEHAGSLRRGVETVGDLDFLCVADDGPTIVQQFTRLPGVSKVLGAGDTKGSVLLAWRPDREIQVDLRVVPAESFGAAWQYFTGSKDHNVRLRERATQRGWTLNEYALTDVQTGKIIAAREEAEIYAALGLPWIQPELREDRGEFSLAATPDDLLSIEHIRGELHLHTTASDGRNTIEEMAAAAQQRGYEYLCITDHSPSSVIANGLQPERLIQHIAAVRATAKKLRGLRLWIGTEVDILADGRLDYPDEVLAQLDFVVASIHAGQSRDIVHNTERTLAAIHNPYVNLIAHPTGRLLNRREAMPLDIERIAQAAAATGTALEINASFHRLDLRDVHARMARDLGAVISINCDAHAVEQFDSLRFGVTTARRAWLRAGDVLNTWPAEKIVAFVAAKRAKFQERKSK